MSDLPSILQGQEPPRQAPPPRRSRRLRHRSVFLLALASAAPPLVLNALWLAGCAADAGDPSKETSSSGITGSPDSSTTPPGSDASMGFPTIDAPSSGADTMGFPQPDSQGGGSDGGAPEDTGQPPEETGPGEDGGGGTEAAPPPPADGGCPSGATVFVATDPGSVTTTGSYGNFNTVGPVCVELMGGITGQYNGWGGNNMAGRTLTLNGVASTATTGTGVVAAGPSGYAIWSWSAGTDSYAGMDFY
jgi:hypothetical protein